MLTISKYLHALYSQLVWLGAIGAKFVTLPSVYPRGECIPRHIYPACLEGLGGLHK